MVPQRPGNRRKGGLFRAIPCALLLGLLARTAIAQAPVSADLTPVEHWVATVAAAGGVADFAQMPAELGGPHHLRGTFLEALLTAAGGLTLHRTGLYVVGAEIDGPLDLSFADVTAPVFLMRCRFHGPVRLAGSKFAKRLAFDSAVFEGPVHAHRLIVQEDASFGGSTFQDEADFFGAEVHGRLALQEAVFAGKQAPVLRSVHVGLGLALTGAHFQSGADLSGAHVDGDLLLDRAVFASATEPARLRNVRIDGDGSFDHTRFAGPADFTALSVTGLLLFDAARFEHADAPAQFTAMHAAQHAFFSGVTLEGGLTMVGATVGSLMLDGNPKAPPAWKILNLDAVIVEHHLALGAATVGTLQAARLQVRGAAILKDVRLTDRVDLRDASVHSLKLLQVRWPTAPDAVWLEGLTWFSASAGEGRDDWRKLLAWLDGARFDAGQYLQLERKLRDGGHREEADEVHIRGERRQTQRQGAVTRWATLVFWDALTGYGKKPARTVWVSLAVILIGAFVFDPRQFEQTLLSGWGWFLPTRRMRVAVLRLLLSMNQFLPGIDLGLAKLWPLQKVSFPTLVYFHFHKLYGWILIPVGLAAVYSQFR